MIGMKLENNKKIISPRYLKLVKVLMLPAIFSKTKSKIFIFPTGIFLKVCFKNNIKSTKCDQLYVVTFKIR